MNKKMMKTIQSVVAVLLAAVVLSGCSAYYLLGCMGDVFAPDAESDEIWAEETARPTEPGATRTREPAGQVTQEPALEFTTGDAQVDAQLNAVKAGEIIPFDEILYVRPDMELVERQMQELTGRVDGCADADEAVELVDRFDELFDYVDSQHTLVMVLALLEPRDRRWAGEQETMEEYLDYVVALQDDFVVAVGESPFAEEVFERRADSFYGYYLEEDGQEDEFDFYAFFERDTEMVDEITRALEDATITYDGLTLQYTEIYDAFDYVEEIEEAENLWLDTHYEEIAWMYIDLIKTRNAGAREAGYDNYMEIELEWNDADYTLDMAMGLTGDIMEHFAPFYAQCLEESYYFEDDYTLDFDEFAQRAYAGLDELSPDLSAEFAKMLEYGYYEYDLPGFEQDPFSIYMPSYQMSVVLSPYEGDYMGMTTFIHEFGHFYKDAHAPLRYWQTDLIEIPSQALELLFARQYETFSDEYGLSTEHDVIFDAIGNMVYYARNAAVSFEHYTIPDDELTPDRLTEATERVNRGLGLEFFSERDAKYSWISDPGIFTYPLGSFGYSTALCAAFELWGISLEDEAAAMGIYDAIARSPEYGMINVVTDAGLTNPFDAGVVESLVALLEENFLYRDWG